LLSLSFAFGLTACGGGGTSTPSGGQLQNVPVTFTVHIPPSTTPAAAVRSPQYISTTIKSIAFRLTAVTPATGTYTGAVNTDTIVTVTTPGVGSNCTGTVGDYTCTATSTAPAPATDTWTIYTYATAAPTVGTTTPLSIYVAYTLAVTVDGPNIASVATWGVPAALAFSPAAASGPANVALSGVNALVTAVQVQDIGGATLIGGNNFSDPTGTAGSVAFTGCPSTNLAATPATLTAANPTALGDGSISIAYDGLAAAATLLCHATAPGGLMATYTITLAAGGTGSVGWTVTGVGRKP
jgi:hypothetical protein